jgi:hypothetical protein
VVRSCGFGCPEPGPPSPNSLQQVLLECISAAAPSSSTAAEAPSTSSETSAAAAAAAAHARGFLNRLFSTMNWCLTEFTVSVGDLHSLRGRRSILEAQNQYRRTGLMFELSVTFMRILEFVVVSCAGWTGVRRVTAGQVRRVCGRGVEPGLIISAQSIIVLQLLSQDLAMLARCVPSWCACSQRRHSSAVP